MKVTLHSLSRWTRLLLACFALATVVPTSVSSSVPVAEKVLVSRDGPPVQAPSRRLDERLQRDGGEAARGLDHGVRTGDTGGHFELLLACVPKRIFILNRALLL